MLTERARELLAEERRRLHALREGLRPAAGAPSASGAGGVDAEEEGADAIVQRLELEAVLSAELDDVVGALARLDAGAYGACEDCGEAIPDERLEVVPATRYCVRHEERRELGGGHGV
jgi:DnaK suppressor protein